MQLRNPIKTWISAVTIAACLLLTFMAVSSNIWFSDGFDVRVLDTHGKPVKDRRASR